MAAVAGTFSATGQSASLSVERGDNRGSGQFNILLSGAGVGDTVVLERSFDQGVNWFGVKEYDEIDANEVGSEPETGVKYRFNATAIAGSVIYRLSN